MAVKGWKEFMERVKNKGVIKKFKKGETILREGSRGFNFYFILKGWVDVVLYTPGGKRVILNILEEGNFFGEMSVLEGLPRSANVEAKTDCEILEISKENFLSTIKNYPECALSILIECCNRLRIANEKIRLLSIPSAEERIKNYLEFLMAKGYMKKEEFEMPSQKQIAEEIGLSRETVSRIFKKLEKEGWLKELLSSTF
jgi:CRP-like cAMP-binding protein